MISVLFASFIFIKLALVIGWSDFQDGADSRGLIEMYHLNDAGPVQSSRKNHPMALVAISLCLGYFKPHHRTLNVLSLVALFPRLTF